MSDFTKGLDDGFIGVHQQRKRQLVLARKPSMAVLNLWANRQHR